MSYLRVTVDGTVVSHDFDPTTLEIPTRADMGEANSGSLLFEDEGATLTLTGHQSVVIEEVDSTQPRIFTGWTTQRDVKRDPPNAMLAGANARVQQLNIVELNAVFDFRQITRTGTGGGNRPAETWQARCTWILNSEYLSDWLPNNEDFIVSNTVLMDEADYRGQTPRAVMDDLSARSGDAYTYFAFFDPISGAIRLFFDNPTEFIAASTISISNVLGDVGGLCFAPDSEATLNREPDEVYSDLILEYFDGTKKLYRSRPSTYATHVRRGTTIARPYTRGLATATAQADKWLDKHAVETDRITCTIRVPAASVGLIQAGQSIDVKLTHLGAPYTAFTTMRIVSYSPKPTDDTGYWYDVELELVRRPAPATPSEPECSFTQWSLLIDSSVDIFGDWMDGAGSFQNGASLYPCTQQITSTHGTALIGTCNDGNVWGWDAGVSTHADTFTATWTFDLSDAGLPLVCSAYVEWYEWNIVHNLSVEATNDLSGGWAEIVSAAESWANFYPNNAIELPSPYPDYRYWRLKVIYTSPDGLAYFPPFHMNGFLLWSGSGASADEIIDLGPTPGATTEHTANPTVNDDATAGYTVGSIWINTTTDDAWILTDSTTGAAVWVLLSGGGTATNTIDANAAPYSCAGDDTTDDTAGIQAAINAASTAAATSGVGIVEFNEGTYKIAGALVSTGNFYAQITLPSVANTAAKQIIILRPKRRSGITYVNGSQTVVQPGPVVFRSTLTGQTYSATHGTPSIFGGNDPEKTATFSNVQMVFQDIGIRAPANPTVCGLNLQGVQQAILENVRFDTTDVVGSITEPTAVTGCSVLMPINNNNGTADYRGITHVMGWYAGPGITEHTQAEKLLVYRCKVALNIQGDYYHAAQIDHLNTEHCPYGIATVAPASGIVNPSGASGYSIFNIDLWDIEDAATGWAVPTYHVNDPGDDYHGRVRYMRVLAGTGTQTGALTVNSAANLSLDDLTDLPATGSGTPATTVESETTWGITPAVGSDTEYARQDHTHGTPAEPATGVGPILVEDTPAGSPLVFADLLQNEEGTDLLYADTA